MGKAEVVTAVEVVTAEIAKLELGPQDVLLVQMKTEITDKRCNEISDLLRSVLGHSRFIVSTPNVAEFSIIEQPEGDHVQD